MLTPIQEEMLSILRKHLAETPKDTIRKEINEINEMNFIGSSVHDYFANLSKELTREIIEDNTVNEIPIASYNTIFSTISFIVENSTKKVLAAFSFGEKNQEKRLTYNSLSV